MVPIFQRQPVKVTGDENFQCGAFLHGAWIFYKLPGKARKLYLVFCGGFGKGKFLERRDIQICGNFAANICSKAAPPVTQEVPEQGCQPVEFFRKSGLLMLEFSVAYTWNSVDCLLVGSALI